MKKLYFILFFLISSFVSYGQKTFDNGGGDHLWSNDDNWEGNGGAPTAKNAIVVLKSDKLILDANAEIGFLKKAKMTGTKFNTVITNCNNEGACNANDKVLTFSGKGINNNTISIVNLEVDKDLKFDLDVVIKTEGNQTYEDIRVFENGTASITFGSGYSLTLNQNIRIRDSKTNRRVNFNGTLLGAKSIKFGSPG